MLQSEDCCARPRSPTTPSTWSTSSRWGTRPSSSKPRTSGRPTLARSSSIQARGMTGRRGGSREVSRCLVEAARTHPVDREHGERRRPGRDDPVRHARRRCGARAAGRVRLERPAAARGCARSSRRSGARPPSRYKISTSSPIRCSPNGEADSRLVGRAAATAQQTGEGRGSRTSSRPCAIRGRLLG